MKYLDDRYAKIYDHKGFDICTLKTAVPEDGDEMGYVIDSDLFEGRVFDDISDAINAIDNESR